MLPHDAFWIADNGNKALVAERLLATGYARFDFEHPAARFDPSGRGFPIDPPFRVALRDGRPASVWLPAYPALAAPFLAWLGTPGLAVPAALGVGASAALMVLWLAPALGTAAAVAGALALVFATPLVFYGVTVWEHSLALACCLGAWIALARPTPRRLALAGALVAVGCVFRDELALVGIATAAACFATTRRIADVVALALGTLPVAIALVAFQIAAYGNPLGPHLSATLLGDAVASDSGAGALAPLVRWLRAATSLVAGYGANGAEAVGFAASIGAVGLAGVVATRRGTTPRGVAAALAVVATLAAWALGLVRLLGADDPLAVLVRYNGILIQLPIAGLAGVGGALAWRSATLARIAPGLVAGAIFLALGVAFGAATPFSSGIHIGPRCLMPAFPALVVLALVAARDGGRAARAGCALLAAAGLASTGLASWLLREQLRENERLAATLLASPEPVVVTSHALLPQQLAPIWDRKPMLLARGPAEIEAVARDLAAQGVDGFALLVPPGASPTAVRGARCTLRATQRGAHVKYLDVDVLACRVR